MNNTTKPDGDNWYAPGPVHTHKMTDEERQEIEAERAKYPWRKNKQSINSYVHEHKVDVQNKCIKRGLQCQR